MQPDREDLQQTAAIERENQDELFRGFGPVYTEADVERVRKEVGAWLDERLAAIWKHHGVDRIFATANKEPK